ncbi:unnamed protein product [Cylindrotheca closterium]|uniref:Uncharacterized protein n=1 Tax=Cylindrotheca closterium TaxID=2856 RepID=A0AAD2FIN1_9STRA|nr:unnamed protein product [Cylindrotheca closterium]
MQALQWILTTPVSVSMSRPAVQLIPFLGDEKAFNKPRTCICEKPECATISSRFRALGDIRGTYVRTPSGNKLKKMNKAERFRRHLCPQKTLRDVMTIDNRGKKKEAAATVRTRRQTEQDDGLPGRQIKFVSWHHLDPWYISQHGLDVKGNNYPLSKTSDDLQDVEKNSQLQVVTEEVVAAIPRTSRRVSPANKTDGSPSPETIAEMMKDHAKLKEKTQVLEDTIRFLNEAQGPILQQ